MPIPAGITELTIEYGPGVDSISCELRNDRYSTISWSEDPITAERDVLNVGPGAVAPSGTYRLTCDVPSGVD